MTHRHQLLPPGAKPRQPTAKLAPRQAPPAAPQPAIVATPRQVAPPAPPAPLPQAAADHVVASATDQAPQQPQGQPLRDLAARALGKLLGW